MKTFFKWAIGYIIFGSLFFLWACIGLHFIPSENYVDELMISSDDTAYTQEMDMELCFKMFKDILATQQMRDVLGLEMGSTTDDFSSKKITDEEYSKARLKWLAEENVLASKVNRQYISAYKNNCFDKVRNTD